MRRIHRRLTLAAAMTLALTACAATDGADETPEETASVEATESAEPTATDDGATESAEATESEGTAASSDDPARESSMTVEELVTEPDTYLGEEIFVTGQVGEELEEESAFTMTGIDADDDEALLVVNEANVVFQTIDEDDVVLVEGTLVEFTEEAMADAGSDLTPDDDAVADYDGEHVLVAAAVEEAAD